MCYGSAIELTDLNAKSDLSPSGTRRNRRHRQRVIIGVSAAVVVLFGVVAYGASNSSKQTAGSIWTFIDKHPMVTSTSTSTTTTTVPGPVATTVITAKLGAGWANIYWTSEPTTPGYVLMGYEVQENPSSSICKPLPKGQDEVMQNTDPELQCDYVVTKTNTSYTFDVRALWCPSNIQLQISSDYDVWRPYYCSSVTYGNWITSDTFVGR